MVLREVVRRGTMRAAAEALAYTPSAVSQQISKLQGQVPAPLFEREGRTLRPTSTALLLADHADLIAAEVERTESELEASLGGIAGAMIGASVGVLSPLLVAPVTIKGLIVTVIGGLGSIPGAIIAGLAVGAFENLFQYFRGVTERDMYVMLLLFIFLTFRPGGIFSSTIAERAFRVGKTPSPVVATPSNQGTPRGFICWLSSSGVRTSGRSRLLYWITRGMEFRSFPYSARL